MSLAVVFKGPEGLVLCADSRVTLTTQKANGEVIHSHFDNATKLLSFQSQPFVSVVTYGQGAIGPQEPRTAHSYVPEFEATLSDARQPVQQIAEDLSAFFLERWNDTGMPTPGRPPMFFIVGGFDEDGTYGRVFEFAIPDQPIPSEVYPGALFGVRYGGQIEIVERLVNGLDPSALGAIKDELGLDDAATSGVADRLKRDLSLPIPYAFLPLQDCVDLSVYMVRLTTTIQSWIVGVRGVGGAIDTATITRTDGFRALRQKEVRATD